MCPAERPILIDDLHRKRHADWVVNAGSRRTAVAISTPSTGFVLQSELANQPTMPNDLAEFLAEPFSPFTNPKIASGTHHLQSVVLARQFESEMEDKIKIDPNLEYCLATITTDGELLTRVRGNLNSYLFPAGGSFFQINHTSTLNVRDPDNQLVLIGPNWLPQQADLVRLFAEISQLHRQGRSVPTIFKQMLSQVLQRTNLTSDLGLALVSARQPKPAELLDPLESRTSTLYLSGVTKDNSLSECRGRVLRNGRGGLVVWGEGNYGQLRAEAAEFLTEAFEIQSLDGLDRTDIMNYFQKGLLAADEEDYKGSLLAAMFTNDNQLAVCSRGRCDVWVIDVEGTSRQVNPHDFKADRFAENLFSIPLEDEDKYILLATDGLRHLYKNYPNRLQQILLAQAQYVSKNSSATMDTFMHGLAKNILADARELGKKSKKLEDRIVPYDLGLVILTRPR